MMRVLALHGPEIGNLKAGAILKLPVCEHEIVGSRAKYPRAAVALATLSTDILLRAGRDAEQPDVRLPRSEYASLDPLPWAGVLRGQ